MTGEAASRFQFALAQNAVIERGYTAARILAAAQDLKSGRLALTVVPGRLHRIRLVDTAGAALAWPFVIGARKHSLTTPACAPNGSTPTWSSRISSPLAGATPCAASTAKPPFALTY